MIQSKKPADIFISYSSKDASVALSLCEKLEKSGVMCWLAPRDVPPGSHFAEQVLTAIENTRATIILLSENSNHSTHVRNEIERAVAKGKFILPIRIQNVLPSRPLELYLSASQWVDAWTPPLEQHVEKIVAVLTILAAKQTDSLESYDASVGVIAVGGGAIRATEQLSNSCLTTLRCIAATTYLPKLERCKQPIKVHLGANLDRHISAGGNPQIGRAAAHESANEIRTAITGLDLIFIVTCLGGGTGTGASPLICSLAREVGALTICIATIPYRLEGSRIITIANQGLKELIEVADSIVLIPNQDLIERGVPVRQSFSKSDDAISSVVRGVTNLVLVPGLINIDFADIRKIFVNGGIGRVGIGTGSGEDRARLAAKKAISNPMMTEARLRDAQSILLNVTSGTSLSLVEVDEAAEIIHGGTGEETTVLLGAIADESIRDHSAIVTFIAMGLEKG